MTALEFNGVSKRFGTFQALNDLSFKVPKGSICGFVGPNGAGKTTTFSLVSGFLKPDSGSFLILGQEGFDPHALKGRLGVLPQDADLPLLHTPMQLLVHLARLQGMSRKRAKDEARRVLVLVRLGDRIDKRIGSLSHGMRRRVAVASALLGSPELILLDEPMAGLDPLQARSLREALDELRSSHTILISSHQLDDLERLCDHVVMIEHGRCVRNAPMGKVTGRNSVLRWQLGRTVEASFFESVLSGHHFQCDGDVVVHHLPEGGDVDTATREVLEALLHHDIPLIGLRRGKALEQEFFEEGKQR